MSELEQKALEETQDALMETLLLLFKVSNRTSNKTEIAKLRKERKRVSRELDRIEIARLNSLVLPEQVEDALRELDNLTKELQTERKRIKNATEKLEEVDKYLTRAGEVLEFAAKLLVFV